MSIPENLPLPLSEPLADPSNRNMTATTKVSENEYQEIEARAQAAGKRLSTWMRDVLLKEVNGPEPLTLLLSEVLGVRMILINILEPMARGQTISVEESQKLLSTIDGRKIQRARDRMAQFKTAGEGV